jgi:hypothetical protein
MTRTDSFKRLMGIILLTKSSQSVTYSSSQPKLLKTSAHNPSLPEVRKHAQPFGVSGAIRNIRAAVISGMCHDLSNLKAERHCWTCPFRAGCAHPVIIRILHTRGCLQDGNICFTCHTDKNEITYPILLCQRERMSLVICRAAKNQASCYRGTVLYLSCWELRESKQNVHAFSLECSVSHVITRTSNSRYNDRMDLLFMPYWSWDKFPEDKYSQACAHRRL